MAAVTPAVTERPGGGLAVRAGDDTLAVYLRRIGRRPLLTAAEERRLARLKDEGDTAARDTLIEANLRLVVAVARRYARPGVPLADLVQEGNLGLIRAVERFDPGHGCRFSTYATWWIWQAVVRGLTRLSRDHASTVSIDQPIGEGDTVVGDLIADEHAARPEVLAADHPRSADTAAAVRRLLPERLRRLLVLRFGLDGGGGRTLEEVGSAIGVTRERARQLEANALARLERAAPELRLYLAAG
jgi:RNA polymerase sigma factor (sigma-70 family)